MLRNVRRGAWLCAGFVPVVFAGAAYAAGLTEQVRIYDMTVELDDQELVMVRRYSWTRVEEDGHDAWRVTIEHEAQNLPSSIDTIHLAVEDLRPLRRYIKQGDMRTRLHYTKDKVQGSTWLADGSEIPIEVTLAMPIIGDVPTAIAELPITPGYTTVLNAFDRALVAVRRYKIVAGDLEMVETPLGAIESYPLELSDADRPGRAALYWVTRDAPHHIVKSESELPDQFGGGQEIATVKSVSLGPAGGQ